MRFLLEVPIGWYTLPVLGLLYVAFTVAEEIDTRRRVRRDAPRAQGDVTRDKIGEAD